MTPSLLNNNINDIDNKMQVTQFAIDIAFNTIWEDWPNKDGESSAKKAVSVYLRSGNPKPELLRACEAYCLETTGTDPKFTYKLSNFINQDHWKDLIENSSLEKLRKEKKDALALVAAWNEACHKHWCKVSDPEERVASATKALQNKAFKSKWKEALKAASIVFRYNFQESDYRQKIILSFRWFTNTNHDKHTVLRLIDKEFGVPDRTSLIPQQKESVPINYEARQELAEEMKSMFPSIKFEKPKPKEEVKKVEAIVISKEAQQIAEDIKNKNNGYASKKTNTIDVVAEYCKEIGASISVTPEDSDEPEFL